MEGLNATAGRDAPEARSPELNAEEVRYMRGEAELVPPSVMITTSKYLNSPNYRDAFVQACLRRQGHDVPSTYLVPNMIRAMADVTDRAEVQQLIDAEKAKNPEFAGWLAARPDCRYRLDNLRNCADGTLGAAVRAFIERSGLDMEFMYKEPAADDSAFISKRQMAVHDTCHLVTGFNPNIVGEVALQFACIGAISRYFSPALAQHINSTNAYSSVAHYTRISLHYPEVMPTLLEGMHLGTAMGLRLEKPLFMYDWLDFLDRSLEDLASELGIARGPGAAWDWTDAAASG
jgi:ubiquinone biosynthesis protein Coq4